MQNLVDCKTPRCGAKYNPTVQWVYGYRDSESTTDDLDVVGRIPLGNCPVCRKPSK